MRPSDTTYACFQCQDDPGGWLELQCPETPCERRTEHAPHPFVVRCPHWLRSRADALRVRLQKAIQGGTPISRDVRALQDLEAGAYAHQLSITTRGRLREAKRLAA